MTPDLEKPGIETNKGETNEGTAGHHELEEAAGGEVMRKGYRLHEHMAKLEQVIQDKERELRIVKAERELMAMLAANLPTIAAPNTRACLERIRDEILIGAGFKENPKPPEVRP